MKPDQQHPRHWHPPQWHHDHGDPKIELEHLRSFALKLLSTVPNVNVVLETPEPGLMDVRVESAGVVAEIHSVPSVDHAGHRRLAIFFDPDTTNETEVYAESIDDASNLFAPLAAFA